jgi:hypothetical protein
MYSGTLFSVFKEKYYHPFERTLMKKRNILLVVQNDRIRFKMNILTNSDSTEMENKI